MNGPPTGYNLLSNGLLASNHELKGSSSFTLPDHSRMVTDCAKMEVLSAMLKRLHAGGHRCLIFC